MIVAKISVFKDSVTAELLDNNTFYTPSLRKLTKLELIKLGSECMRAANIMDSIQELMELKPADTSDAPL